MTPIDLSAALETFSEAAGRTDVSLGLVWVFLWIAQHQGHSMGELTAALDNAIGASKQGASRHCAVLGPGLNTNGARRDGLQWVTITEYPRDRRSKLLRLTLKGHEVFCKLCPTVSP